MRPRPAARCSSRPKSTCRPARITKARRGASGLTGGVAVAAILLGLVLPGTAFAEVPQPGTDVMRAAGSVEITVDGIGTDYVRLIGDVSIVRQPPDPVMPGAIPIEILSMNLTGFSPVFGKVSIAPCTLMASTGLTRRTPGVESPSDSFFDVWFDIALPDRGLDLTQAAYFRIEARTTAVPFFDVFTGRYSQMIPLVDDVSGVPMGTLTHVALDPNPRIDRLATQAQLDWTLGTVREVVNFSGVSLVVASDSWTDPGPVQVPEFNTELVAMDLTGGTPIHGPMEFHEQMQIHSPGRSVAQNPGPSQFPADSFFDVFFEISGFFTPGSPGGASASSPADAGADPTFYNSSGTLVLAGSISSWPAFNTPFKSPGPAQVPLFDRSTGQMVGTANGLQWVWTQPAGGCVDADGDGVFAPPCGTDCNDADPNNYPGNLENCLDGRDNNCNQAIDCLDPLCTGRRCDDGDRCTNPDVCTATGTCVGQPIDCNDNNLCTLDHCNPSTGLCEHVPVNCDDQNPCTADSCVPTSGQCVHAPIVCNDNNPCTQDACDPASGQCTFTPTIGLPCNDGDPCTRPDRCVQVAGGVICQGPPADCNDNDPCTLDQCDPLTGLCQHPPVFCDDHDPCTTDRCNPNTGLCEHVAVSCDDGNQCTKDSCDPQTGQCVHDPQPGAPCNDGDVCTQDDKCVPNPSGGIGCQGIPVNCDDQNPCTFDRCDPATGACVHDLNNCNDGDPCTTDSCDPATGACLHTPISCDDQNQCTQDSCDPDSGVCKHVPLVGQACDDGNACTDPDRCVQDSTGGVRCQGPPVNCDDQNPCTNDSCNPSGCIVPDNGTGTATLPPQGCGYATQNDLQIINGLPPGTTIDIPSLHRAFVCPAATPSVCSFPSPIPGVDCDQAGGSLGGEQECADSILEMHMSGTGALLGFNRIINVPVSVEENAAPRTPGDPVQSFNAEVFRLLGQITNPSAADPDFDLVRIVGGTDFGLPSPGHTVLTRQGGNWAVDSFFDITYRIDFVGRPGGALAGMSGSTTGTARFRTRPGGCVHTPVDCDDQDPCTTDRCNPTTGACEHLPVSCDDGNQCTKDSCDSHTGLCLHDPQPGAPCNDGDVCTQDDKCVQGPLGGIACQGTPVSCDDLNPCTFDRCDPGTGACVHILNTCDDGDACTQDACNPATGACEHRPVTVLEPGPIKFSDQVTIEWPATPDATHWNTYRGSIPMALLGSRLPAPVYDQACFESDDAGANGPTTAIDMANPPRGTAYYYLTSGENTCGESAIGHPSSPPGAVIPNTMPCPTPP